MCECECEKFRCLQLLILFVLLPTILLHVAILAAFKFELTEKPIYWNLAPVTYPTVVADGSKPELPLKVTMLE